MHIWYSNDSGSVFWDMIGVNDVLATQAEVKISGQCVKTVIRTL